MSNYIEEIVNFLQLSAGLATAGQPTITQYPAIAAAGYQVVINLALTDSPNAVVDEGSIAPSAWARVYSHSGSEWTAPTLGDFQAFRSAMDYTFRATKYLSIAPRINEYQSLSTSTAFVRE